MKLQRVLPIVPFLVVLGLVLLAIPAFVLQSGGLGHAAFQSEESGVDWFAVGQLVVFVVVLVYAGAYGWDKHTETTTNR